MKKMFCVVVLIYCFLSCTQKKTELVLLGTVHQPIQNFTPDSLYNILVKIDPDLILFEVDSSFFTEDFKFIRTWGSNENIATVKYMNDFEVDVRPYEFSGRNDYRINIGARPTDGLALKMLDSLYLESQLTSSEEEIYRKFIKISDSLNSFAYLGAKAFNTVRSDSVAQQRQEYHYKKLLKIIEAKAVFHDTFYHKKSGDSISYALGFKRAGEFWDLRNKTMSNNILHFIDVYKGQRIVVLNGYFHRYYLNYLIKPRQQEHDFMVKDFYEYQ